MRKITLLLFLLSFSSHFAQVCQQTFSVSGPDTSAILTVESSELYCYGGTVNSITISAAQLGGDAQCNVWYTFTLDIDGVVSTVCAPQLVGMTVTDFESITITAADNDNWTDTALISLTFTVDYTLDDVPYCDAVLTSPEDGSVDISADGQLSWSPASGGVAGYKLSMGSSSGATDVLNASDVGNVNSFDIPGELMPNTSYYVKVIPYNSFGDATGCAEYTFTTCGAFDDFTEDFTGVPNGSLPACWSSVIESDSIYPDVYVYNGVSYLDNSDATEPEVMLITPSLNAMPLGAHRARFMAFGSGGGALEVGTMSDPGDSSTFTLVESFDLTGDMVLYDVTFDAATTDTYLAFRHGLAGFYQTIGIDNIAWEPVPTEAPLCIGDLAVTINDSCGNFPTTFLWTHVDLAEGYTISIGSAPGLSDIVDNVDIGYVTEYEYSGTYATTYHYTVTPYNAFGPAVGCTGASFETAPDGCHCTSEPSSFDGDGITNIQLGSSAFPMEPASYTDLTAQGAVVLGQGLNTNVQITFMTGWAYSSNIWIDLNDNYVFEPSELLSSDESTDDLPAVLNASFMMPEDAALGEHRMRIATAYSGQSTPNPCFSEDYGVTADFLVSIIVPACTPPAATATVVSDCENNQFFIDVDITDLGNGTPMLTNGDDISQSVTTTGTVQLGPFENGSSVNLTLEHGPAIMCDTPLGAFSYICPPINDECSGAIALTVNEDFSCAVVTPGTTAGSTGSEPFDDITGSADDDVWFSFVATGTSHKVSLSNIQDINNGGTDMGMAVYNGSAGCGSLVFVDDSDPNSLTVDGLVAGVTYYVRVYGWYDDGGRNTFNICIGTPPAPPVNDEILTALPLIVDANDCDGVTNNGTNSGATDSGVDITECFYYGDNDVWFSFLAPFDIATVDISTDFAGGTLVDSAVALYEMDGDEIVELDCDQDSGETILSNGFSYNAVITDTPVTAGQTYYVRVSGYTSDDIGSFCVQVTTNQVLSTGNTGVKKFAAWPNPVSSIYTVENETGVQQVEVLNLLGQRIISEKGNGNVSLVDMSGLSAGTYIVKVYTPEAVKTLKVIKE